MRRIVGALVVGGLTLLPIAAQAMTVETFLTKAKALQASGPLALASSDLPLVRAEIKTAADAYRAQIDADKVAGKTARACPPPKGKASVDAKTLLAAFEAIPPAKRGMSVKTAFYGFMDKRYPC